MYEQNYATLYWEISMSVNQRTNVSYGLNQALINNSPTPIASKRNPSTTDYAAVGTVWCNVTNNEVFILASIVANVATWQQTGGGGGAGNFASLTVTPGPTSLTGNTTLTGGTIFASGTVNINTAGAGITDIGGGSGAVNIGTGTGAVNIGNGTGNTTIASGDFIVTNGSITLQAPLAGYILSTGVAILSGAGDPNGVLGYSSPQGSLFLRTDGSSASTRGYINTNGATAWTAITTAT